MSSAQCEHHFFDLQLTFSAGGVVAVIACTLFPENAVALPIFGFLFSLPCFYIITQYPNYAQAGRFVLLTYVSSEPFLR